MATANSSLDGSIPGVKSRLVNEFFNNTQRSRFASGITIESSKQGRPLGWRRIEFECELASTRSLHKHKGIHDFDGHGYQTLFVGCHPALEVLRNTAWVILFLISQTRRRW
jgi:hypothetical protein